VSKFIIYLRPKFHISSPSDSLVIAVKSKLKYKIRAAAMFYYILQKIYHNKHYIFLDLYYTEFLDPTITVMPPLSL